MFLDYVITALVSVIITILIIYFFFIRRFLREFTQDRVMYCTEKQLAFEETMREDEKQKEENESKKMIEEK